jgi:DNA-binding transcriptional ArsR family regulator
MNKVLSVQNGADNEESILFNLRPEFNRITYNSIRSSIIHLLVKAKELNHALSVEEIAYKLGKRHSVIIHHLEKLFEWKIVDVVKSSKYGKRTRRSIWGLNLKYPNLIQNIYSHMLKTFYTQNELDKMCSINKCARKMLVILIIAGILSILPLVIGCAAVCGEL